MRGKHREGLSELAFAALFSLGFSPLYHSVCCPAVISGKATVETKRELLERSNNLWFLFSHKERGSPEITQSSVVNDVTQCQDFNFSCRHKNMEMNQC